MTVAQPHLGVKIDGLLGFPFFRDCILTLDYSGARLRLSPPSAEFASPGPRTAVLAFNNEQRVPFIPVQLGNESFAALIDTGSDAALTLNALGLLLHEGVERSLVSNIAAMAVEVGPLPVRQGLGETPTAAERMPTVRASSRRGSNGAPTMAVTASWAGSAAATVPEEGARNCAHNGRHREPLTTGWNRRCRPSRSS